MKHIILTSLFFTLITFTGLAQDYELNYDESKVPDYTLPSILETQEGEQVTTVRDWRNTRRPEIMGLYEELVYGQIPSHFDAIEFDLINENPSAIESTATLKEVDITITRNGNSVTIRMNLFIPNAVEGAAPAFLLINHRPAENIDPTREVQTDFWPVERVIPKGYAMASFHVGDVADDDKETWHHDIVDELYPEQLNQPDGMKALGGWGWGAMRLMDYFERDSDINEDQVVLIGHSRGGKSALWTAANDERFAIVVSNESGCGGAALYKREFSETIKLLNDVRPHWFCDNLEQYNDREADLPVDQHMLIASIAPRPVYVGSAEEDLGADPKGEFLALKHGSEVYEKIYHLSVNVPEDMPAVNQPIIESYTGYHIRSGEHDLDLYDWDQYIKFADYHFGRN
ncbi:MAG: alpha/beta hydrolase [Balneolaceae bacterium]|nr:alpha/beta hydrolase [Balneolaceae bacterium]MDR9407289.1 alpha/beta hydrolase [Balneolaceae bacterium]